MRFAQELALNRAEKQAAVRANQFRARAGQVFAWRSVFEQGTSSAARLARQEMVQLIPSFFLSAALCKFLGDPSFRVNRSQQHAPTRSHEARATAQMHWRGLRPRVVAQRRRFAAGNEGRGGTCGRCSRGRQRGRSPPVALGDNSPPLVWAGRRPSSRGGGGVRAASPRSRRAPAAHVRGTWRGGGASAAAPAGSAERAAVRGRPFRWGLYAFFVAFLVFLA